MILYVKLSCSLLINFSFETYWYVNILVLIWEFYIYSFCLFCIIIYFELVYWKICYKNYNIASFTNSVLKFLPLPIWFVLSTLYILHYSGIWFKLFSCLKVRFSVSIWGIKKNAQLLFCMFLFRTFVIVSLFKMMKPVNRNQS